MVNKAPHRRISPAGRARLRTIALVGIDGSGKTTQAHRLAGALAARGLRASYRRNAGGRRWFGRLATVLGRRDAEDLFGRRTVLLIESVLRWLAIARTLLRRRFTGEIAVMDRYAVCQYASLRSHAAEPDPDRPPSRAERRARLAYRLFPTPDVTFLLAVDPAVAYDRIEARGYDHETMEYLNAAAAAYRALPEYDSFVVIDADAAPDEVAAAIEGHLTARLSSRPLPDRTVPDRTVPDRTVPDRTVPDHTGAHGGAPEVVLPAARQPCTGAAAVPGVGHGHTILLATGAPTVGAATGCRPSKAGRAPA